MAHSVKLNIAGTVFRFFSDEKGMIPFINRKYKVFLSHSRPDIDVFLRLNKARKKNPRKSVFAAPSLNNDIFSADTRLFNATVDFGKKRAYIDARPNAGTFNVIKFLSSVFLMRRRGFLLHASSVIYKKYAYVFFGPSGSGKTTIARLSKGTLLSDETTAISPCGGRFWACATPFAGDFYGVRENGSAPIKAVFLLKKDSKFRHSRMDSRKAVQSLFESVMIPVPDPEITDRLFVTFDKFVNKVPCHELYFRPEPELWRYIDEYVR